MIFLYALLALMIIFIISLLINTLIASRRAPGLKEAREIDRKAAERYAERLGRMIRCRTVSVKGSFDDTEFKKLRDTVAELFPLVHERAERLSFSDDCWFYRIPGRDRGRNIMLMSHHDVVPAEGEWEHGAFSGELADGKVWGRGTVDTKTPLFAEFSALEELLEEGIEFPCNVCIASSHNEELSGDGIPTAERFFKEQGISFELILDEGGAVIDPPMGGMKCKKCAMLAVHEKGRYFISCTASPSVGHAGLNAAAGLNSVERMAGFISEAKSKNIFVRRLNPQVSAMFRHMGPYCGFPLNVVFANLKLFGPVLKKLLPGINPQAAGLIGSTCSFGGIKSGPEGCSASASLRPVDGEDLKRDLEAFRALAEKHGIETGVLPESEYHGPADMTRPQFKYTMDCLREFFPDCPAVPFILPAGTDARTFTDICPCVLRFAPIRLSAQQLGSVHSENENIDAEAVAEAVGFYKYFLRNYR